MDSRAGVGRKLAHWSRCSKVCLQGRSESTLWDNVVRLNDNTKYSDNLLGLETVCSLAVISD